MSVRRTLVVGYALFLRVGRDPGLRRRDPSRRWCCWASPSRSAFPSLNIQATNGVADHEQGLASGLLNTSVQVGGALVLAVVTAVLTSDPSADPLDSFHAAIAVSAILGVVGLAIALTGLRRSRTAVMAGEETEGEKVLETV